MNNPQLNSRLAVCSWSLQPTTPEDLLAKLNETGLKRVQLALDPLRENPVWKNTAALLGEKGIEIVSGMFGTIGEDYTTLDTIRMTGGIAPDKTWPENLKNLEATAGLAKQMGLKFVSFHAGFLPHDASDPVYLKMIDRLGRVADIFAAENIQLGFETGQETAPDLRRVLETLKRPNIGVNFDPANMILYAKGNPIEALRVLGPWIRQVHIKDADSTKVPGTWGAEVVVGTGEVDWSAFFQTLKEQGYSGNLVIEREAGNQRAADIRSATAAVDKHFC